MPKSAERCREIREQTREMILQKSMLYFARHGFAGTKISDLAKFIGIGQGTMYIYFKSKEELFIEIHRIINRDSDIKQVQFLGALALPARQKIRLLTETILKKLKDDPDAAAAVVLNTQLMFEQDIVNYSSDKTIYQSEIYEYTAKIFGQGQEEGCVVSGSPLKLADYYWGVIYLYAFKKLFTTKYEMIGVEDLERIILKGESQHE